MKVRYEQLEIPEHHRLIAIREDEAHFIFDFLHNKSVSQTLETGFAYGCSTAYIISATEQRHIAIDPFQEYCFANLGIENIRRLGLDSYLRLIQLHSHIALPNLVQEGTKIDFAFIDGGHKFDDIFIDWFYIDIMLNMNGHVLFHDTWMESTKAVASFIRTNRDDYREITISMDNMYLFQKVTNDSREWAHFRRFEALS